MQPTPASPSGFDLAALRQSRSLSLEAIAEATKISIGYLRAIEEGRFESLPGGIYDVSYLRQYARAIDFDEEELLRWYEERTGVPGAPTARSAPLRRRPWTWLRGHAAARRGI